MTRRPFLLLSLVILLAAAVQAFSSQSAAEHADAKVCGPCGPICSLK
jgi:hypothetical protein